MLDLFNVSRSCEPTYVFLLGFVLYKLLLLLQHLELLLVACLVAIYLKLGLVELQKRV